MAELSEDEAKDFEEHYFQCETCFNELRIAEEAVNLIKQEGPSALYNSGTSKQNANKNGLQKFWGWSPYLRWGTAIVSASVIALILIITLQNNNDLNISNNKLTFNEADSLKEKDATDKVQNEIYQDEYIQQEDLFADLSGPNFKTNPYMEEWINESTRSGSEIIDTIFSPKIGEKFNNENVIFKWKMNRETTVFLKVLSNLEEEIVSIVPEIMQSQIITVEAGPDVFNKSGLYYWRIEDRNEVLFVGKFYYLQNL
jgi:hypothetical protein